MTCRVAPDVIQFKFAARPRQLSEAGFHRVAVPDGSRGLQSTDTSQQSTPRRVATPDTPRPLRPYYGPITARKESAANFHLRCDTCDTCFILHPSSLHTWDDLNPSRYGSWDGFKISCVWHAREPTPAAVTHRLDFGCLAALEEHWLAHLATGRKPSVQSAAQKVPGAHFPWQWFQDFLRVGSRLICFCSSSSSPSIVAHPSKYIWISSI